MPEEITTTMKEDLAAAFEGKLGDEAKVEEPADTEETSTEETATEESAEAVEETKEEETVVEGTAEEGATEEDATEEESASGEEAGEDSDEDLEPVDPLYHWADKDKEMFKTLDPKAQRFLIERDKKFQANAAKKHEDVADIRRAFDPVKEDLVKHGISEADAVRRLIGAHVHLTKNPVDGIKRLMGQYRINPSDIIETDGEGAESGDSASTREIQELKQRLEAFEKGTAEREQFKVQQEIADFATKNEFFAKVETEMSEIAWSYRARKEQPPGLAELYEKACWANEEVRAELIKRQREKEIDEVTDPKKLSKSQRAAKTKVNASGKTSTQTKVRAKTMRDQLEETFDEIQAR